MKKVIIFTLLLAAFCIQKGTAQISLAQISDNMETLGDKMDVLGDIMEKHGLKMEKYGKEIERNPSDEKASDNMSKLGDEMSKLGDEMSVLGDEMSKLGDEMGVKYEVMLNWFFEELKNDGLIESLKGDMNIEFKPNSLKVNGKKADAALFNKYKKGFERHWGRALKSDFSFTFKGKVEKKNGKISTEGTNSNDF
jgi:hypothetical protein